MEPWGSLEADGPKRDWYDQPRDSPSLTQQVSNANWMRKQCTAGDQKQAEVTLDEGQELVY